MAFKNFTFHVIVNLLIIIGLTITGTYFYLSANEGISVSCGILIIIDVLFLIYSFNRTNRSLAYFFESVRNEDSQLRLYSKKKNKSIQRLYESMNRVNSLITETKLLNQRNEQYYKELIQQSATGLIALNEQKNVEIANDKACELVGIMVPSNFKRLEQKNHNLWSLLCNIQPGGTETFKFFCNGKNLHLLIKAKGLRFDNREIKLISIQDIHQELDVKETESWQKLISILTHEIMNSIAPITSLTTTLTKFFKKNGKPVSIEEINNNIIENTLNGLEIIGERGNGLLDFVTNYRRLSKIPTPVIMPFNALDWLNNIKILLYEKLEENKVILDINVEKYIKNINADEKLLTQVILNLIYNAVDALKDKTVNKKIKILIESEASRQVQITVANNGAMIPSDLQEKIFIPFFTTKENGSGIGLSLSRQIIQLHHGYIYLESDANITKFIIVL
jgi:nitrogen fixation/metabolism regulation signal transduction histidine kinase